MSGLDSHLDQFGLCQCKTRSSIDSIRVEEQDEWGRYRMVEVPMCGDCFGVL